MIITIPQKYHSYGIHNEIIILQTFYRNTFIKWKQDNIIMIHSKFQFEIANLTRNKNILTICQK